MTLKLSEQEITLFRKINARIQGHFGGLAKSRNKIRASRTNVNKATKSRLQAAHAV